MEDEDNFKCNNCNNTYRYEGTLKTHIMVKHCKSNSYNCDQCKYHRSSVDVIVKTQTKGAKSDTDKDQAATDQESAADKASPIPDALGKSEALAIPLHYGKIT